MINKEPQNLQPHQGKGKVYVKKGMISLVPPTNPTHHNKNPFQITNPLKIKLNKVILKQEEFVNYKLLRQETIDTLGEFELETCNSLPPPTIVETEYEEESSTASKEESEVNTAIHKPSEKSYSTNDNTHLVQLPTLKISTRAFQGYDPPEEQSSSHQSNSSRTSGKNNISIEEEKKSTIQRRSSEYGRIVEKYLALAPEIMLNFKHMKETPEVFQSEIEAKTIILPNPTRKIKSNKTLILDLDDTLIHTMLPNQNYSKMNINKADIRSRILKDPLSNKKQVIKMILRPYAVEFLKSISKYYEVIIFTAAEQNYADILLDVLDPGRKHIDFVLYRNNCIKKTKANIKDLRIIQNRDVSGMIIVDNLIVSFINQLDNGIHIPTFLGNHSDRQLLNIKKFLTSIYTQDDLRDEIKKRFSLNELYGVFLEENVKQSFEGKRLN